MNEERNDDEDEASIILLTASFTIDWSHQLFAFHCVLCFLLLLIYSFFIFSYSLDPKPINCSLGSNIVYRNSSENKKKNSRAFDSNIWQKSFKNMFFFLCPQWNNHFNQKKKEIKLWNSWNEIFNVQYIYNVQYTHTHAMFIEFCCLNLSRSWIVWICG